MTIQPRSRARARFTASCTLLAATLAAGCGLGVSQTPGGAAQPGGAASGPSGPGEWKPAREQAWGAERQDRTTTNLFVELLGKTEAEVDEKLKTAVDRFFGIGTGEPNQMIKDSGYRVYFELPQDPTQAFIWTPDTNDIRSEGMSYGMMIAVQMNLREQFDRLWKFARTHMQYPADTDLPAWRYYFRWQGKALPSSETQWDVKFGPQVTPAPDGEEYFAAALYLADRRWGSTGEVDYKEEAAKISWAMLNNRPGGDRFPIIHPEAKQVVFVPYGSSNEHSDPSYHLPAFYELFAEYGPAGDAERWREVAKVSHEYFVKSAHPETGLHPDYAKFNGTPTQGYQNSDHDRFRYDAWRTPMNMGVAQAWFPGPPSTRAQIEKYHAFFSNHLGEGNVTAALFNLDGSNPSGGGSTALTASLAAAALDSGSPQRKEFVENAWLVSQQSGQWRYYQECVYLLGLLATAGRYHYDWAATP